MSTNSIRILKIILLGLFVYLSTVTVTLLFDRSDSPQWLAYLLVIIISSLLLLISLESIPGIIQNRFSKHKHIGKKELSRVDFDSYVKNSINEMSSEEEIESEVKIFRNAIDFSSMKVRDCMVPRADIVAVSLDTDVETLKDKFIETGLSRILVYKDDIDDIVGYIHMWEMFSSPTDWTKEIASISFYPDSMLASNLMSELLQQHKSIAVVVDEFGGTTGIITTEDLVEEIFGEIEDEHDIRDYTAEKTGENEYLFSYVCIFDFYVSTHIID